MAKQSRQQARKRRHARVRKKIAGTAERPRLNIYRSLAHIYAQLIDDHSGTTLVQASSIEAATRTALADKTKVEQAAVVGAQLAERAKSAGVTTVVFDRGGFKYHGRVKALADAAREAGLKI